MNGRNLLTGDAWPGGVVERAGATATVTSMNRTTRVAPATGRRATPHRIGAPHGSPLPQKGDTRYAAQTCYRLPTPLVAPQQSGILRSASRDRKELPNLPGVAVRPRGVLEPHLRTPPTVTVLLIDWRMTAEVNKARETATCSSDTSCLGGGGDSGPGRPNPQTRRAPRRRPHHRGGVRGEEAAATELTREELVRRLADVSHQTWMRQKKEDRLRGRHGG
jgi:hypothetical protein